MLGYQGKILQVDLGSGEIKDVPLDEGDARNFIGGTGLSARLVYDSVRPGMDPMAPASPLVFAAGPFTGTAIPMVSRSSVSGISPYTGIWGEATTGGSFPFGLKNSGYDAIYITGKAAKPVYIFTGEGRAEIRDASRLWGRDTYATQAVLKDEMKERRIHVSCIGKGGENLVPYACVINDRGRAAGRCGMGALMGSKNLKAVVVSGKSEAAVADRDKISELAGQFRELITNNFMSLAFREYGTMLYIDMGMYLADLPAKYFTRSVFPAEKITGQALKQAYSVKNYACHGCPIGCGRVVKGFRKSIPEVDGPEYETAGAFGSLCMNFDLDSIIMANHLCNSQGIDTISAGVSIAYAMHLYEKGILTEKKAGMPIKWGDGKTIIKLVEMIIHGKGIGELLGKGTRAMARELGADPEEAAQVKGLEIPMHDGRAFFGEAISYATGPRGACHQKGDYYSLELGGMVLELDVIAGDRFTNEGKGVMAAKFQGFKDLFDSLCMCKMAPLSLTQITDALNAVTGLGYSPLDLYACGERSLNLKRAINNRLGVTRKDDRLPRIAVSALQEGASAGKSPDMDRLLRDYYAFMKWDWDSGKPSREKLLELGLQDVAADLWN
jgi:aldehyde:ferredoxin oxidoreductase